MENTDKWKLPLSYIIYYVCRQHTFKNYLINQLHVPNQVCYGFVDFEFMRWEYQ